MASKQISYCSLEEAWDSSYPVMYSKDNNMLSDMPNNDMEIDGTILNERSLTKSSNKFEDYYMNLKNKLENKLDTKEDGTIDDKGQINCDKFISHYLECDDCKDKVNKVLGMNMDKQSVMENFTLNKGLGDGYLDILVLILVGIFIIFIFDCFVRLGKNLR